MCGIAGAVALRTGMLLDPASVACMLPCLAHRGPDDEGLHTAPGVVLGHRRLSIIDVTGGHQPLFGASPHTVLVCNGEVYNYRELAAELRARGHTFRTASDSEVVAHAYDEWGDAFLDRLDGMFAFALWDGERSRLVLARDRMGEKPLYYATVGDVLYFASELTALLPHVPAEIDPVALSQYLALEYVPAPRSIIRGIAKLEPGTALFVQNGNVRAERYWRIDPVPMAEPPEFADAAAQLRALLRESVRSRLVSDVPLGVFLSGGIDSSAVAAFAAAEGALETFSMGFEERSFDERSHARLVADHIGSRHHERVVQGREMLDLAPQIVGGLDEPLGDASIIPTTLLSRFARESVTVALGGDGGDELFAGYPMHQAHRVAHLARAVPGPLMRAARALRARSRASTANFSPGFKIDSFLRGASLQPPLNHAYWMSSFHPGEQQALLTESSFAASGRGGNALGEVSRHWQESAGAPLLARATHLDATTYLPGDILAKVDRAGMSVGLEVRAPFLARDVVDFAFNMPDAYRMRGVTGKRLLRAALTGVLPESILQRGKKGFGMPVAAWLKGPMRPIARDLLSSEALRADGYFEPSYVQRLLDEHEAGRRDHRKPLWTLLAFQLWQRSLCSRARAGTRARV